LNLLRPLAVAHREEYRLPVHLVQARLASK
jgi:hypothetical protein